MSREILTTGPEEHLSDQNDKPQVVDVIITSLSRVIDAKSGLSDDPPIGSDTLAWEILEE